MKAAAEPRAASRIGGALGYVTCGAVFATIGAPENRFSGQRAGRQFDHCDVGTWGENRERR